MLSKDRGSKTSSVTATSNIVAKVGAPCYAHTAYGLRIQSPFALPFQRLDAVDAANADVRIRLGPVPARLRGRPRNRAHGIWESVPGALLLRMEGVARFFVSNGTDVVVEPEGGSEHEIAVAMLGCVFGALLQQRGIAAFDASAVATPAGALLFIGPPGDGKSTALAAMTKRGHAMLADDVTGVILDDAGRPVALPAFPTIRLWGKSLDALQWRSRVGQRVHEGMERYFVAPPRFHDAPLPVRGMFVAFTTDGGIELQRETTSTALSRLLRYTHRKRFLHGMPHGATQFRIAAAMAKQVRLVAIGRPIEPFLLDALTSRIEAHLDGDHTAVAAG